MRGENIDTAKIDTSISPATWNMCRAKSQVYGSASHTKNQHTCADEYMDQTNIGWPHRNSCEEYFSDQIGAPLFHFAIVREGKEDKAGKRNGEEDPYYVAPCHH